jgi:hypothetical protein
MKLPDFLEKKEKLFSPKTTREEARTWGDRYREAQRIHDAVAFYLRAGYKEGLAVLRQEAVESGDFQLFEETLQPQQEDWTQELRSLARTAEEKGRWNDAKRAYAFLGDELGLKRVKAALEGILGKEPPKEPGGQAQGEDL